MTGPNSRMPMNRSMPTWRLASRPSASQRVGAQNTSGANPSSMATVAYVISARRGFCAPSHDIPEKTESYFVEVDPSVEYADDKTKLGTSPGVKGKVLTPGAKPATP